MRRHISNEKNWLLQICNTLFLLPPAGGYGIMSPRLPTTPMRPLPYSLSLAFLLGSGVAWSDDAGLLRCRAIAEGPARLACYDRLPLTGQAAPAAASRAPGPAAPQARTPPAAPPASPDQFGLAPKPVDEVNEIHSSIPGVFDGWRPNERIRLANGQVWQIADDTSSRIQRRDPKVTVRRGALGAFYLDVEGDNRSPRVRRVQ